MYILSINSVIYLVFYKTLPIKRNFSINIPTEIFRILKGKIIQYTKMQTSNRKYINLQGHTSNSPLKAAPYTNIFLGTQPRITHLQANTVLKIQINSSKICSITKNEAKTTDTNWNLRSATPSKTFWTDWMKWKLTYSHL